MLGVIAFNSTGMASLMYYILVYIFSNLAAFGVIQAIENATGRVSMDDYNGLYKTNPRLASHDAGNVLASRHPAFRWLLQQVLHFTGALQQGTVAIYVLVLIALINTIVSLYYYLLVVKEITINQARAR